jgi:hypothetical protein
METGIAKPSTVCRWPTGLFTSRSRSKSAPKSAPGVEQTARETAVEAHYIIARRAMKNGLRMQYATCPDCAQHSTGQERATAATFTHIAECTSRNPAATATAVKREAEEGLGRDSTATPLILKRAPIGDN